MFSNTIPSSRTDLLSVHLSVVVFSEMCPALVFLQAMLNRDFRQRPIAEAVLNHRFVAGAFL